jgi:hypothetical protein
VVVRFNGLNNKKIKIRKNIMPEFDSQENNQFIPQIENKDEIIEGANGNLVPQGLPESMGAEANSGEAVATTGQDAVEKLGELGAGTVLSPEMAPKKELSEIQRQNSDVMDALFEKFPFSFIEGSTADGRKYIVSMDEFSPISFLNRKFIKIISQEGIADIIVEDNRGSVLNSKDDGTYDKSLGKSVRDKLETVTRALDFSPAIDARVNRNGSVIGLGNPDGVWGNDFHAIVCNHFDFSDPNLDLESLNKMLVASEEKFKLQKRSTSEIIAILTAGGKSANEEQFK